MRVPIIMATMLALALAIFSPAAAGVSVRAQVDRTAIAPGESVELQVTVDGGKGEADLSGLKDFKVVSQGTSSSVQFINGRMSRKETGSYLLMPRRRGRLTIPALPVEVDGKIYRTDPIMITVANQADTRGGTSENKEVWVTQDVSAPAPYEGQQITYTFRLFSTVQINDAKFQPPEFEGFSAKEIKDRRSYRKIIDGREAMVSEIDYVLTPLKAASLTIEPAVLQIGIVRSNRNLPRGSFDDFFRDPFFNRGTVENRILQTDPLNLDVKPLPPQPGDRPFSGLVGQFELGVRIEGAKLKVGDSATVAVTVQGRGNIMDARPPGLQIPPAFKAYADNPQEEISMDRKGFHGKKIFRTALVPLEAGWFELPAVSLTYFDVDQKAYRTLTASAPALTVAASKEGSAPPVTVSAQSKQSLKKKVTFTGRDILPLKENLDAIQPRQPVSWLLFLLGLAAPALVLVTTLAAQRLRRRDTRPAAIMKAKALQALKAARKASASEFLTLLHQALTAAILAAAGRMGAALTWKEAEALLLTGGGSPEEARQTADLLSRIESSKFSGLALPDGEREELLTRTRQTIKRLLP